MKPIPPGTYVVTLTDQAHYGHVMRTTDIGEAQEECRKLEAANYDKASVWQTDMDGALQRVEKGKA